MTQKVRGFIATNILLQCMPDHGRGQERDRGLTRRVGTTLLEVAVCVIIVGISITALMESMASGTRANRIATDTTVGLNLVRSAREWAGTQSFANLQGLCTTTKVYSPVIGGQGDPMAGYTGWSQEISAREVSSTNLTQDATGPTNTLRLTITATRNGSAVSSLDWLVMNQAAATQPVATP